MGMTNGTDSTAATATGHQALTGGELSAPFESVVAGLAV